MLAGSTAWLLLGTAACGTADPNLFGTGSAPATGGSSAGSPNSTGSSGMDLGSSGGGAQGTAGADTTGSGGSGLGCAFSCGDAGRNGGGAGGGAGDTNAQAGSPPEPTECSALAPDALFLPATQHCYLVDTAQRTFAAAQAHCAELKAHLVTLGSEAENDFAWSIHGEEHWVGAKDGKQPKQSEIGTYTWVTGEPFEYSNWSPAQPNASKTECVEGGDACYEHCAFQWKGGDRDNQWNDRYCMHEIASICEWDSRP
ncbi:MAG TPA: C-type lectin domain-containing protein [Polyangiaceae bacterium]|nr:C-type lectin domain-containing protein [Polyangiaceae bacterium]